MKILLATVLIFSTSASLAEDPFSVAEAKKEFQRPDKTPYLDDNPYSKEKHDLGKMLFFDPRMSKSNMISCSSCHNPSFAWGDSLPKGVGHEHKQLGRKTPTILNLAWYEKLMWDGRFNHYEGQAMGPVGSAAEMAMTLTGPDSVTEKLNKIKGYAPLFKKAFPKDKNPINTDNMSKALAIFERGIVSSEAPFDKWIKGDEKAISASAKRGFTVFNTKGRCVMCHAGWNLSDGSFHDIGLAGDDIGRGRYLASLTTQQHAFKTPGLRNIDQRGPYMHDGSEATLEDVVAMYNRGGDEKRPSLSSLIKPLKLSKTESKDLVEFMKTLTSEDEPQTFPVLPR